MRFILLALLAACLTSFGCGKMKRTKALAAYDKGEYAKCESYFLASADANQDELSKVDYYSAACCAAKNGDVDSAFAHLDTAAAKGFKDWENVKKDEDLASLRGDVRWAKVLVKLGAPPQ